MAASRAVLLALLALVATASAAAVKPGPQCSLRSGGMMAGGWQPVADSDEIPDSVFDSIKVALVESVASNSTWVPCDDVTPVVSRACSQVVAGQNIALEATLECTDVDSSVGVDAEVFVPLPYTNADPVVTKLAITSVDGEALKPKLAVV